MKLEKVIIKNFRSYDAYTEIKFDDLTTIVGKNDVGKSTVLEALEIFFNNSTVKIDAKDYCVKTGDPNVLIGCVFSGFAEEIILDETAPTTFKDEFLLNEDGMLEVHKIYDCSKKTIKPEIYLKALYPNEAIEKDKALIQLTQTELQRKVKSIDLENGPTDLRTNHLMRKDIFSSIDLTNLAIRPIALNKGDSGTVWEKINPTLPIFTLFQSDRPSLDGDSEVQDPMKVAIKEALEDVREQLEDIEKLVQEKAMTVANLTLEKLKEMDPLLANELTPSISETPKWPNVFKLTLEGDEGIPINKRGSGVRRLILLNFFRAAAEKQDSSTGRNIIYAIEEPETAQHPSNQIMLAEALLKLSKKENTQVILTTHVPAFASLLPTDSLRLIVNSEQGKSILSSNTNESVLEKIAETLGVIASPISRGVKVAVFVEGPNDLSVLKILSSIIARENPQIVDLSNSDDVVIIPCGGDTLRGWVENQYLKQLNVPEIHIYDRDIVEEGKEPKYEKWCKKVRERNDGSVAYLTTKREIENYIHPDAIKEFYGLTELMFGPHDDVPNLVASLTQYGESNVKKKLNNHVARRLTYEQIKEMDTENDIEGKWLLFISQCVNGLAVETI
ncbi:ATP-binding protein [Bacillus sp. BPN334]|uniref:ATP-binding protein n=1 Tax=Bacillus sp. BPN334 TaxID=2217815 RepID=UPI0015D36AE5|nr:ATP-binding protein [Bacillus sp. BPN334]